MTTEVLVGADWWNRLYENEVVEISAEQSPYVWTGEPVPEQLKQETEEERNERIWRAVQDYSKV